MDATSVFVARELKERIEDKRREWLRVLIQGSASDYSDYKQRAGYLKALEDVEKWIDEINAEEDEQGRGPLRARAS